MTDRKPTLIERFTAQPLRRQLLVLLMGAQLIAHASTIAIVSNVLYSVGRIDQIWVELSDALSTTLTALDAGADQDVLLTALTSEDARFSIVADDVRALPVNERIAEAVISSLPSAWQSRVSVHDFDDDTFFPFDSPRNGPIVILAQLPDRQVLQFLPNPGVVARNAPIIASTIAVVFLAIPLGILAVWSGAFILRPVERLSVAAQRFSVDARTELLAENGSYEVRSAIRSFNTMQQRLRRMMDDRAQTLASIGHDLRTPLTRLGLRLETVALGDMEAGVRRDIAEMRQMIDDALAFLSTESKPVNLTTVNLTSLCESAVSDFTDQGADVTWPEETEPLTVQCDISLTQRALTNLIDNGLKYAGRVDVRLDQQGQSMIIRVADQGPGIPAALMDAASKPFNRLETTSAGKDESPGGFGLGLAIAEDCMTRQGGALILQTNTPTGLIAKLRLPADA